MELGERLAGSACGPAVRRVTDRPSACWGRPYRQLADLTTGAALARQPPRQLPALTVELLAEEQPHERARQVEEADRARNAHAGGDAGTAHDEGHAVRLLEGRHALEEQAVRAQVVAVVGREDDERVIRLPRRLQRGEKAADLVVEHAA